MWHLVRGDEVRLDPYSDRTAPTAPKKESPSPKCQGCRVGKPWAPVVWWRVYLFQRPHQMTSDAQHKS